jgi:hypothetical protein
MGSDQDQVESTVPTTVHEVERVSLDLTTVSLRKLTA